MFLNFYFSRQARTKHNQGQECWKSNSPSDQPSPIAGFLRILQSAESKRRSMDGWVRLFQELEKSGETAVKMSMLRQMTKPDDQIRKQIFLAAKASIFYCFKKCMWFSIVWAESEWGVFSRLQWGGIWTDELSMTLLCVTVGSGQLLLGHHWACVHTSKWACYRPKAVLPLAAEKLRNCRQRRSVSCLGWPY